MALSLALIPKLITLLPALKGLFKGKKKGEAVEQIMAIGKDVLGVDSDDKVMQALADDPEQLRLFQEAVMKDKYTLEEMFLEDVSDARDMYKTTSHAQSDKIADRIMILNLPFALLTFTIQVVVTYLVKDDPTLIALTNSLCTMLIKSLLDERKDVCGFYFGSSLGSKIKNSSNNMLIQESAERDEDKRV